MVSAAGIAGGKAKEDYHHADLRFENLRKLHGSKTGVGVNPAAPVFETLRKLHGSKTVVHL